MGYTLDDMRAEMVCTDEELTPDQALGLCETLDAEFGRQRQVFPVRWDILGIKSGDYGLIVGSGTGIEAFEMQQQFEGRLRLDAIDANALRIEYAERKYANEQLMAGTRFKTLDALATTAASLEQPYAFAEMRRVLGGARGAVELIRHLRTLLVPRGLILIDDHDIDRYQTEPFDAGFEQICELIQQGRQAAGGIRCSARAIALVLAEAGCSDIRVEVQSAARVVCPRTFLPRFIAIIPKVKEELRMKALEHAQIIASRTEALMLQRNAIMVSARA